VRAHSQYVLEQSDVPRLAPTSAPVLSYVKQGQQPGEPLPDITVRPGTSEVDMFVGAMDVMRHSCRGLMANATLLQAVQVCHLAVSGSAYGMRKAGTHARA
jgi:hypothetical protein